MNLIFNIHKFDMNDHIRLDKPMEKIIHSSLTDSTLKICFVFLKYISDIGGSNSYTNLDILRCKY